jgi:DnaJ-domain-containing protein 1
MAAVVTRILQRNVDSVFERTPYVLVRLDRANAAFPRGIAEYLDRRFPELVRFGLMSRADWPEGHLASMFQSSLGPLRGGVRDGFYLFAGGHVVGFHGTAFRPPSVAYGNDPEEVATRERVERSPAAVGLTATEKEQLRQLVAYFEPIVERRQQAAGFGDDGTTQSSRDSYDYTYRDTAPPPPPRSTPAPAPSADDPYVILGIAPGATPEEIKAAYKNQLKLNHPDKVAHLSPALQAFAQQQTLAVKSAYETLIRRTGG